MYYQNKEADNMQIKYNVTGAERKALVAAMRTILNDIPHYEGAPTFAYTLGAYTIDKAGTVSCPEDHDSAEVQSLISELEHDGFNGEMVQEEQLTPEHPPITMENGASETIQEEPTHLSISLPRDGITDAGIENLKRLVASKAMLLKKAIGTDALPILVHEDKIEFPWFPSMDGADAVGAYSVLVASLFRMASEQKRVTAVERPIKNEKYEFRCFLLRLGMIGEKFKPMRKYLLRNLSGNSAFKAGQKKGFSQADLETAMADPETRSEIRAILDGEGTEAAE